MSMVDVSGLDVNVGDEVILFGKEPTIQDLANISDTIPYEILTNVSSRVKKYSLPNKCEPPQPMFFLIESSFGKPPKSKSLSSFRS